MMMWCLSGKDYYSNRLNRQPHLQYVQAGLLVNLTSRFGNLMAEIQTEKQKPDKDLDDWADMILDLAYRAFTDLPEARVERLAIIWLCQGCNDRDAGHGVITGPNRPASVNSTVEAIRWYQLSNKVIYCRQSKTVTAVAVESGSDNEGCDDYDPSLNPCPSVRAVTNYKRGKPSIHNRHPRNPQKSPLIIG